MRTPFLLSGPVATCLLAGCAGLPSSLPGQYHSSADVFMPAQAQQTQSVTLGTVLSVRHVSISATTAQTAGGSAIGAAVGGLLGHQVGGGTGRTIATVAGALGGAVATNLASEHAFQQPGLEITVKLDSGNVVSLTQAADVAISAGERVQLVASASYGQPSRVIPLEAAP
ncbi:MAG: glycine zipper 2TM domain-containing protein [Luteibacter sp.]